MTNSSARGTDLLAEMTLEEKVAQLTSILPTVLPDREGRRQDVASDRLGRGIGYLEQQDTVRFRARPAVFLSAADFEVL